MTQPNVIPALLLAMLLPAPAALAADAGGRMPNDGAKPAIQERKIVVLTGNQDGQERNLRVEARDGHVTIESEADPDRAWLGVIIGPSDDGLGIRAVVEDSPAAKAGLVAGDVIVRFAGRQVDGHADLAGLVAEHSPGDAVDVVVRRDGREVSLTPRLSGHPGRMEFDADDAGPLAFGGRAFEGLAGLEALEALKNLPDVLCLDKEGHQREGCFGYQFFHGPGGPRLGVIVETMSDQLAGYFGVEGGEGLLVKEVVDDSPASRAGLEAGDVILAVGGTAIRRTGDIRDALKDAKTGDRVDVEVLRRGSRRTFAVEIDQDAVKSGSLPLMLHLGHDGAKGLLPGDPAASAAYSELLGDDVAADVRTKIERARAELEAIRERSEDGRQRSEDGKVRQERRVKRQLRSAPPVNEL